MITLSRVQNTFIYAFVFFGPLGTLLTPGFLPYAFRFYQLFLPFFPLFFLRLAPSQWKIALTATPFLLYCMVSAFFTHQNPYPEDAYPLFRSFLLFAQTLFVIGAACCYQGPKIRLIKLYLAGYLISLAVGYLLFLGYYTRIFSLETIQRFSVEAQIGWSLLRFSPGTYPNEYGNISSFVLATLLIFFGKKRRFLTFVMIFLTFVALLLTTTRAAQLSFFVSLIYLSVVSKDIRKILLILFLVGCTSLFILKSYSVDYLNIFIGGLKAISFTTGTTGERITTWTQGFYNLNEALFFGNGFGSEIFSHNIYFELLFELGLVGVTLLIGQIAYHLLTHLSGLKSFWQRQKEVAPQITTIALIHVALFALTNHNLHHHLTFFSILLFNLYLLNEKASYFSRIKAPNFSRKTS